MNYKTLFITGLLFEVSGQVLLAQGNEFVYALKPIDFAHWSLLLGAVLMTPQVVSFPNKFFSYVGSPVATIGLFCMTGMCVLDFIWWSQPNQEIRNEFASHLSKFPSIWKPFISIGPNLLTVGLFLLSLNYFKKNKLGVSIIILATSIAFFGRFIPHRLIYTYLVTAFGFSIIFYKKESI